MSFTEATKANGISDDFLTALLLHHGWPKEEVFATLGSYWERTAGIQVPSRIGRGESSRDAFLYLLSFATLATWASALGSMLFRFIEYWFPDPVAPAYAPSLRSEVTWQMAAIVVAFPIFLFITRTIVTEAQNQPDRWQSGVRKWLTYFALLLTAGGLISDLICFLDYFLTGEITVRFLLKTFAVFVICGGIFAYYLASLRWNRETDPHIPRTQSLRFAGASSLIVVAALFVGLGLAGLPSAQRLLQADQRRVQDLRSVATAIHWRFVRPAQPAASATLPVSLNEISGSQPVDPQTKQPYTYRVRTVNTYELCADFAEPTEATPGAEPSFWHHGKGQTCFALNASELPAW